MVIKWVTIFSLLVRFHHHQNHHINNRRSLCVLIACVLCRDCTKHAVISMPVLREVRELSLSLSLSNSLHSDHAMHAFAAQRRSPQSGLDLLWSPLPLLLPVHCIGIKIKQSGNIIISASSSIYIDIFIHSFVHILYQH